jgi:hypothetical protein
MPWFGLDSDLLRQLVDRNPRYKEPEVCKSELTVKLGVAIDFTGIGWESLGTAFIGPLHDILYLKNTTSYKRVTPLSVLFAPSTRGILMLTLRRTHVIASHMGALSVDRVLLLPMRRVKERR